MVQLLVFEVDTMVRKKDGRSAFGACLLHLRQQAGLTQAELGKKAGLSKRMVTHYERRGARIPVDHMINFARALNVSVDVLLGIQEKKATASPRTARLLNRLRRVETFPDKDRRAVLDYIDALAVRAGRNQSEARAQK